MPPSAAVDVDLRQVLLARLARLRAPAGARGAALAGAAVEARVFNYCVYERERIRRFAPDNPAIVVVLSGLKEVWRGEACQRFGPGEPFVMAAGVAVDVVNIPDPRSGRYESLCINVDADLRQAIRRIGAGAEEQASGLALPLTPDLVEAYGHAAVSLADPVHGAELTRHRILEILLVVRDMAAARPLFAASLAERAEAVIGGDLARAWRVDEVAAALGMGGSTLRRRLKAAGASFRDLMRSARMRAAGDLLERQNYSVTEAAQAAGYASRSHFARRFRTAHGVTPSRMRRRA